MTISKSNTMDSFGQKICLCANPSYKDYFQGKITKK